MQTRDTDRLTDERSLSASSSRPQPQLFLIVERHRPMAGGARYSLANIDRVTIGRGPRREARRFMDDRVRTLAVSVPDTRMSRVHARIERQGEGWTLVDCGSTNGSRLSSGNASDARLADGEVIELASTFFRFRASVPTPATTAGDVDGASLSGMTALFGTLLPELARSLEELGRVAASDMSVLLLGASGTGKEVLANGIHRESGRGGPFVPVNCGALPAPLVESLLFGHRKGAFSGATQDTDGFLRAAHGGTLFLDEVGDLPLPSQTALLRVLQDRQVTPVGASRPIAADVRVIAATNRDLSALVQSGKFRQDLFARLAVFRYELPTLRERMDDLGLLIATLLARRPVETSAAPLTLGATALRKLLAYSWPDNVRELEHCLAVSQTLAINGRLDDVRIANTIPAPDPSSEPVVSAKDSELRSAIVAHLASHGGNVTRVGEAMGKSRTQIQRWLKRLSIDPSRFRG